MRFAQRFLQFLARRLQLAAGRHDVAPARTAYGGRKAGGEQAVGKALDGIPIAADVLAARPGVEGDQVDLRRDSLEQSGELLRLGQGIVDILQHDILEGDAPRVVGTWVAAAGGQQLGQWILLVEGHDAVAQLVGHRVQRNRQVDAELLAATRHHRHHTGGRQRDLAAAQGDAGRVHDDGQGLRHVVEVIKRLAHTHHDDVGQAPAVLRRGPLVQGIAGDHELPEDLARCQVAHQALGAGVAEAASQGAADLAGNAEGAAVLLGDEDRFHLVAVGQAQQPLVGAVAGKLMRGDLRPGDVIALGQLGAKGLRQAGHYREIAGAAVIDPVP